MLKSPFITALIVWFLPVFMIPENTAQACDPPPPLTRLDLSGDGIPDTVEATPCPSGSSSPGTVTVTDGATG